MSSTKAIPKISGLRLLRNVPPLLHDPLNNLAQMVEKYGGLIEYNAGKYQQLFFVSDADIAQHILKTNKTNYRRSPVIKALKPLLGNGIFIAEDENWKQLSKQMRPAFHEQMIRDYERIVREEANDLYGRWSRLNQPVTIERDVELLLLRILIRTLLVDGLELDYEELIDAHGKVLEDTSIKVQKLDFFKNKLRKSAGVKPKSKRDLKSVQKLKSFARGIIEYGKTHRDKCGSVLGLMLDANSDDQLLEDQVLNLLFAGYDTTASGLSWTLYALATNTSEQEKLRLESQHFDDTYASLNKLPYTKMFVQEALRLYPPVWSIHRQSLEEDEMAGHRFASGSYFMICAYTMHRDPAVWEKPNTFYPEHFEPSKLKGKAFQYIPFGQGERVCIGKPMAMMELQYLTAYMAKRLKFSYHDNKPPMITPGIIIKSKDGIKLNITPRD
jgi:cytochrome P450